MDKTKILISLINKSDEIPYDLLLLSDDTIKAIDKNLNNGECYLAKYQEKTVAVFILKVVQDDSIEIKNIAVTEELQGKGIGTILIDFIIENAKKRGFEKVLVGTCDQCVKEIKFYEKSRFAIFDIRKNFFLDNYSKPIYENGKQIIDMVLLKIDL
ncbi:GNAT family N-acetyltransferase [Runella sp.]|uniref:GNAT family N-acetyltransferase n=1 Tax=Runella sp. TaxID=1960881 RepID=UPI003D0E9AFE